MDIKDYPVEVLKAREQDIIETLRLKQQLEIIQQELVRREQVPEKTKK